MKFFTCIQKENGQSLITLLFFTLIGITIISAITIVLFINLQATTTTEQGLMAYYTAEQGAEDGILQLLRDPSKRTSYGPYNPIVGSSSPTVTISYNGTNTVIHSVGYVSNAIRVIEVQMSYNSGAFTVVSWKEVNN